MIVGTGLFVNTAIADNPFSVHFDSTVPFMEDNETLIFDGVRIEGFGLSAENDALRVKFNFDFNTLNFVLNRYDIKVYSDIGIFHEEHMAKDVLVSQPRFVANGFTYSFGSTYNFEATANQPFIAELNLEVGHVVSWLINNQSNDYSYELTGENVDSKFLGESSQGVISGARKILANGVYRLEIMPTNSLTLTFSLQLYNANNRLLQELVDNQSISVAFENSIRDYAKYKVTLGGGDKLTVPKPSSSNIRLKLVDSLGKVVTTVHGLTLIYEAENPGMYYLFIDNRRGHGGSYNGTVSIDQAPISLLSIPEKQNSHKTYDKANAAMPEL